MSVPRSGSVTRPPYGEPIACGLCPIRDDAAGWRIISLQEPAGHVVVNQLRKGNDMGRFQTRETFTCVDEHGEEYLLTRYVEVKVRYSVGGVADMKDGPNHYRTEDRAHVVRDGDNFKIVKNNTILTRL